MINIVTISDKINYSEVYASDLHIQMHYQVSTKFELLNDQLEKERLYNKRG